MAKEVSLKIVADASKATEATKGLKQQLKEATKEAQLLAAAGDTTSEAYIAARNKLAELQDQMRDFNDELKALDPGAKFQTIANVATGIAGGFQAAQGAMALFGKESEDVEKALLKVQAATALAQGIDQARELGKYWDLAKIAISNGAKNLLTYIGVVEGATVAQNILNVATKAFQALQGPIGLALAAVSAAVAIFTDVIMTNTKAQEEEKKALEDKKKALDAEAEARKKYKEEFNKYVTSITETNKSLREELTKINGVSRDEELAAEKEHYKKLLKQQEDAIYGIQGSFKSRLKAQENIRIIEELHRIKIEQINKKFDDQERDRLNKQNEEILRLRLERNKKENENINQQVANYKKIQDSEENQTRIVKQNSGMRTEILAFDAEKQKEISDKRKADELKAEQDVAEAKAAIQEQFFQQSQNILNAIGEINSIQKQKEIRDAGDNKIKVAAIEKEYFERNKKLQIAQATISTAQSAIQAFNSLAAVPIVGPALGAAAAAAAVAAGAIQIAKIKATQFDAGGSVGSGGVAPISNSNIPTTNAPGGFNTDVSGQRIANQTGEGANQQGQFRVYVLESDITATQDGVAGIKRKAKVM